MLRWHAGFFLKFAFVVFFLTGCLPKTHAQVNGGHICAACAFAVGLIEQLAQVHNASITSTVQTLCMYLPPGPHRDQCQEIVDTFGPMIIQMLYENATPDVVCNVIKLCRKDAGQPYCHLYPEPKLGMQKHVLSRERLVKRHLEQMNMNVDDTFICELPGIKFLCKLIENFTKDHQPAVDLDEDGYSTIETLRGTSWKGRDCSDIHSSIYPGARPFESDIEHDANCNGIYGVDKNGHSYEESLCPRDLVTRGIAVIGDSAFAHFHIPEHWLDPRLLTTDILTHLPFVIENEFDWPMMSATTGYMNITWPIISGNVQSLYTILRERNHCIHRDYQNLAVNGADIFKVQKYQKALTRNQTSDRPLLVVFGLVGNDVCNRYPDTVAHMTTPKQMRENLLASLEFLNSTLPHNSKLLLIGLADGRVLYDSLQNRLHPIGRLNKDVTYPQFYEFLNCLEISPCHGWMTKNATLRDMTAERVKQLNEVLYSVANQYRFSYANMEINFLSCPLMSVIEEWTAQHGPESVYELIEPVDGFHPNQIAQELMALFTSKYLAQNLPSYLGDINPHNQEIRDRFGDQGGY